MVSVSISNPININETKVFFVDLVFHRIGVKLQAQNTCNDNLMKPLPNSINGSLFMANSRSILQHIAVGLVLFSLFPLPLRAVFPPTIDIEPLTNAVSAGGGLATKKRTQKL